MEIHSPCDVFITATGGNEPSLEVTTIPKALARDRELHPFAVPTLFHPNPSFCRTQMSATRALTSEFQFERNGCFPLHRFVGPSHLFLTLPRIFVRGIPP